MLITVDNFDKYCWGEYFKTQDAIPVAKYMKILILKEGAPKILTSDNGGSFVNEVMGMVLSEFTDAATCPIIDYTHPRPRNPAGNGEAERTIRTIFNDIQLYFKDDRDYTDIEIQEVINQMLNNYNNSRNLNYTSTCHCYTFFLQYTLHTNLLLTM